MGSTYASKGRGTLRELLRPNSLYSLSRLALHQKKISSLLGKLLKREVAFGETEKGLVDEAFGQMEKLKGEVARSLSCLFHLFISCLYKVFWKSWHVSFLRSSPALWLPLTCHSPSLFFHRFDIPRQKFFSERKIFTPRRKFFWDENFYSETFFEDESKSILGQKLATPHFFFQGSDSAPRWLSWQTFSARFQRHSRLINFW